MPFLPMFPYVIGTQLTISLLKGIYGPVKTANLAARFSVSQWRSEGC